MDNYVNQQEENRLKQTISNSGPIDFTQNNIINDNYNDLNIDDKLNLHKDEEFLPELKKINEFYHNVNDEVVKYKDELLEVRHQEDDEVIVNNDYVVKNDNSISGGVSDRERLVSDEYDSYQEPLDEQVRWRSSYNSNIDLDGGVDNYYNNDSSYQNNDNYIQQSGRKKSFINRMFK